MSLVSTMSHVKVAQHYREKYSVFKEEKNKRKELRREEAVIWSFGRTINF